MRVNFRNGNSRNTLSIPLKKGAQVNIYGEKNTNNPQSSSPVMSDWMGLLELLAGCPILVIAEADNIPHAIETYVAQEIILQVKDQIRLFSLRIHLKRNQVIRNAIFT